MIPSASRDPSYVRAQSLIAKLPFKGMATAHRMASENGFMREANNVRYDNGYLIPWPGTTATGAIVASRPNWTSSDSTVLAFMPGFSRNDYMAICDDQVLENALSGPPSHHISPAGTISSISAAGVITGSGTAFDEDLTFNTILLVSGRYYPITSVSSATIASSSNTAALGAGSYPYELFYRAFDPTPGLYVGPRYCFFAGRIFIVGRWGIYGQTSFGIPASGYNPLKPIVNWRAVDVIPFAGRPIFIGAKYFSTGVASASDQEFTNLLAWPTRSDPHDMTSYGSGELELVEDGAQCVCGAVWGGQAFVFTRTAIYRLQPTGMGASNPIGAIRVPIENYEPPTTNAVAGKLGIFYHTIKGPMLFDGQRIHNLAQLLEWPVDSPSTSRKGFLWYNSLWGTIHLNNASDSVAEQIVIHEDPLSISQKKTITNDYPIYGYAWSSNHPYIGVARTLGVASTTLARRADENGSVSVAAGNFYGGVLWAGITGEVGPQIYKVPKKLWIVYSGGLAPTAWRYDIGHDGDTVNFTTITATSAFATSTGLKVVGLDPAGTNCAKAAPIWQVALTIPPGFKLYEVVLEYDTAGNV